MSARVASRGKDALIGIVYLAVIVALVVVTILIYNKDFSSFTTVTVRTDSVGTALQAGSDVKVRGILVGSVDDITTNGEDVDIHVDLDPDKADQLPANVKAQILPKTLFGERYVDLELPSDPSRAHLKSGAVIPQDTSKQAIEVQRLFQDLLPLLQAVQPDKLNATLGEISALLRDRGQTIAETMTTVGNYLDKLSPQVPKLTSDLAAFAKVADTYNTAAPDLIDALQAMTTTSKTIVAQKQQLETLYSSVTQMSNTVGEFVGTNSTQIIGLSKQSLPSLQVLARYSSEFPCIGKTLVGLIPRIDKAFGAGTDEPGAHVILQITPSMGKYVAGRDTPTFNDDPGPRCPGTLQPAGDLPSGSDATTSDATTSAFTTPSLGAANSPAENRLINELVAPAAGTTPDKMPGWSSLLLGPALRGATVTLK